MTTTTQTKHLETRNTARFPGRWTLALLLVACGDLGPDVDYSSNDSTLIGSTNAVIYNATGATLSHVHSSSWSADWTHVVPVTASDGTRLIFVYARELGTAKILSIASDGSMVVLSSMNNLQTGWDEIVASKTPASSGFNLLFYRRTDGLLRGMRVASSGVFSTSFSMTVAPPTEVAHPGWDYMTAAKMSGDGEIVFYDRLTGEAIVYRFYPAFGLYFPAAQLGWQTIWDQIESGDLDGDGVDDLVLYSQDTGDLKIAFFDSTAHITGSWARNAEPSAGAQLAVGDFGGSWRNDVLLYQVDGSPTFENGRLRIWTDDSSGSRTVTTNRTDVQDGWTHVVPVGLGQSKKGIFFYSNQRVIKAKVIPVRKNATHSFAWNLPADDEQLQRLANGMRKTFAAAGIAFDISRGTLGTNATLGSWVCGDGDHDLANQWLDNNVAASTLPIILALQSDSGAAGCSGLGAEFVKASYSDGLYDSGYGFDTEKHYAHEIGHYFGLRHTYAPGGTVAETNAALGSSGDILTLDLDVEDDDPYLAIYDTPPALSENYWQDVDPVNYKTLMCDAGSIRTIQGSATNSVDLVVQPYNVMNYNQCSGGMSAQPTQGMARLSRQQIRIVRQTLYGPRKALL